MIEIEVNDKKVISALNKLQKKAGDLTPILDEIGDLIASEVALNFRDASDPYGKPWQELKHRDGKPLNDTGRLKDSITYNIFGYSVEVGTNVEYAPTHQFGAKKGQYAKGVPWGDIPARPFLPTEEGGLPVEWQEDILDIISSHLEVTSA